MADIHGDRPEGFYENKRVSNDLAGKLVQTLGKSLSDDKKFHLTMALGPSFMTRDAFVEKEWGPVQMPSSATLRECIARNWLTDGGTLPFVAIEVGMRGADAFNIFQNGLDPVRIFSFYEIASQLVDSFHAASGGQTLMQAVGTVAGLVKLLKETHRTLNPEQVAIMGVAHQFKGKAELWNDWLTEVNGVLAGWNANAVTMQGLKSEVEALKLDGFTIVDTPTDLRIPRVMVVVPIDYFPKWIHGML